MIVTTYKELREYLAAFKRGHLPLLIVRSDGGHGKSYFVRYELPNALVIAGHATPLSIFLELQSSPASLVVFNDVDSLMENKTTLAMLKQVCELHKDKEVHYHTTSKALEGESVFKSNNKVLLLCNDMQRVGKNIGALMTRAFYIDFRPTNAEVMRQLKKWATDSVVVTHLEKVESQLSLNFRIYEKCVALKKAKLDWQAWLITEYKINVEEDIIRRIRHLERTERDKLWCEATGGKSPATYYRILNRMLREGKL
jgi:hypothetical protein